MRFILVLLCVAGAGFSGWVFGSLHPAPDSVLDPIRSQLAAFAAPNEAIATTATASRALEPIDATEESLAMYRFWIREARELHPYAESEDRMYAVMMCESGGNASIVNPAGPYTGLFQYSDETWRGAWNTYRDGEITEAQAQIFATALAWSLNMQSHWGCYRAAE